MGCISWRPPFEPAEIEWDWDVNWLRMWLCDWDYCELERGLSCYGTAAGFGWRYRMNVIWGGLFVIWRVPDLSQSANGEATTCFCVGCFLLVGRWVCWHSLSLAVFQFVTFWKRRALVKWHGQFLSFWLTADLIEVLVGFLDDDALCIYSLTVESVSSVLRSTTGPRVFLFLVRFLCLLLFWEINSCA